MGKKIITQLKDNLLWVAFFILGGLSLILGSKSESEDPIREVPDVKSADTFIPQGFTLVPLEISNAESLSSLIGDVGGVVDLYLASNETQKGGLKVGTRLKILRAPLNPQQYAVLVKDSESSRLLSFQGPFIAVIQNPQAQGTKLTSAGPSQIRVDYQN